MAGVEGVEPSHTAPETAVLPLDDTPINKETIAFAYACGADTKEHITFPLVPRQAKVTTFMTFAPYLSLSRPEASCGFRRLSGISHGFARTIRQGRIRFAFLNAHSLCSMQVAMRHGCLKNDRGFFPADASERFGIKGPDGHQPSNPVFAFKNEYIVL